MCPIVAQTTTKRLSCKAEWEIPKKGKCCQRMGYCGVISASRLSRLRNASKFNSTLLVTRIVSILSTSRTWWFVFCGHGKNKLLKSQRSTEIWTGPGYLSSGCLCSCLRCILRCGHFLFGVIFMKKHRIGQIGDCPTKIKEKNNAQAWNGTGK